MRRLTEQEKQIEQSLVRMIRSHGGTCLKFTSPGNTGVPDRVCVVPGVPAFFVETKRPKGGVVSEKQRYWKAKLEGLGTKCWIVKDQTEINEVERWLIHQKGDRA